MENVNHPNHYQSNGKECIKVMEEDFSASTVLAFCVLNSFKYHFRKGRKDGNSYEQDNAKAVWYENYAKQLYKSLPLWKRILVWCIDPLVVKIIIR